MPRLQTPDLSGLHPLLQEAIFCVAEVFPHVMLVGGVVRDLLLGQTTNDVDMEVYGVPGTELEEQLRTLFPERVHTVGQAFGILKVSLGNNLSLDVAIPRRESKNGKGHTGFLIQSDPHLDPKEASRRRDFTINAIALHPKTGELVDPWHGKEDLEQGLLRVVDHQTFQDDPLRVYRAAQFVARFDLHVDQASFDLMNTMVERGDLAELSKERITEEMRKLLQKSKTPSQGLDLLFALGIIERDYPELFALKRTPQEPEWHPEGDVWIHTLMAVDAAAAIVQQSERGFSEEEKLDVVLSTLCHDLGKPSTTRPQHKDGIMRIRSLGHEEAGIAPTRALLHKWTFGEQTEKIAVAMAADHLKPGLLFRAYEKGELPEENYANAIRKLLKRVQPATHEILLAVAEADHRGRGFDDAKTAPYEIGATFRRIMRDAELDHPEALKPLIQGKDLLAMGLPPGPHLGSLIRKVELARDDGRIKTREEALTYLKETIEKMR